METRKVYIKIKRGNSSLHSWSGTEKLLSVLFIFFIKEYSSNNDLYEKCVVQGSYAAVKNINNFGSQLAVFLSLF